MRVTLCRPKYWAVAMAICILLAAPQTMARGGDGSETQDLIRSAMIFNFCKFVQWPGSDIDTLVLGVMVLPDESADFSSILGKTIQDSPIAVRYVDNMDDLAGCQLLYIPKGMEDQLSTTFAAAQTESILTISEIDGFCSQGGIIQLVERRGKLRFFINRSAADKSRLVLSSQLLKMAKIVEG